MLLRLVFSFLALAATSLVAQDMSIGSCNLSIVGAKDKDSFLQFDRELREAIDTQDAVKMALLVNLPFSVNERGHGSISIGSATTLQERYSEIFTADVRATVLKQKVEEISCNYSGIMYGNGTLWVFVTPQGYGIQSVNLPRPNAPPFPTPRVVTTCNADLRRVAVDRMEDGTLRYRAWERPRSILDAPDVETMNGTTDVQGTGVCANSVWTFQDGASEYVLSGVGCWADSNPPPDGARGRLTITRNGETELSWCF